MTPELKRAAAAARFYEGVARGTVGAASDLARLYNLERARFLRGQVNRIAPTAGQFGGEIGYQPPAG